MFHTIPNHSFIKQQLVKTVAQNRISHAQMFAGNEGNGALSIAIAYAKYILCLNKTESDACNECSSCIKMQKLNHPDLHFSIPILLSSKQKRSDDFILEWKVEIVQNPYMTMNQWLYKMGNVNKQPVIGKDESQSILKKLSLKSYEGGYKIMIIWMAEYLNISASNKLLKLIEEPPQNTLFIFITENVNAILPTIISRTQITKIPPFTKDEISEYLQNQMAVSKEAAQNISLIANGNLSKALELSESQDENQQQFLSLFQQWMRINFKRDVPNMLKLSEDIASMGRGQIGNFLQFSSDILRKSLIQNYAPSINYLTEEESKFIQNFSPFVQTENAEQILLYIDEASRDIERNANPKILFTDMSLKMFALIKKQS